MVRNRHILIWKELLKFSREKSIMLLANGTSVYKQAYRKRRIFQKDCTEFQKEEFTFDEPRGRALVIHSSS